MSVFSFSPFLWGFNFFFLISKNNNDNFYIIRVGLKLINKFIKSNFLYFYYNIIFHSLSLFFLWILPPTFSFSSIPIIILPHSPISSLFLYKLIPFFDFFLHGVFVFWSTGRSMKLLLVEFVCLSYVYI